MTMTSLRGRGASLLAAGLLSAALVLTACGSDNDNAGNNTDETRTVKADNGAIEIPADPQRVATIGNTGLPFIDLGGEPAGVSEETDSNLELLPKEQQATYEAATTFAPYRGEVDLERLASLKPDLILVQMDDAGFEKIEKQLEAIAPTVFWGLDTEWKAFADRIAEAGNLTDGLSQQKAEFADKVAKIQEKYGEIIDDTSFVNVDRWAMSEPGTFVIANIGCVEIATDDLGIDFAKAADGKDPSLSFERIGDLSKYDVILYPVDAEGQAEEVFAPVVGTNAWKALPAVNSGHALGVFCPGNNSYGSVLRYLDSLDRALASLPAKK